MTTTHRYKLTFLFETKEEMTPEHIASAKSLVGEYEDAGVQGGPAGRLLDVQVEKLENAESCT